MRDKKLRDSITLPFSIIGVKKKWLLHECRILCADRKNWVWPLNLNATHIGSDNILIGRPNYLKYLTRQPIPPAGRPVGISWSDGHVDHTKRNSLHQSLGGASCPDNFFFGMGHPSERAMEGYKENSILIAGSDTSGAYSYNL